MSAMAAKRQEVVGKDQDGRDVYADKSVVVPGSLRPDGTRRKDLRVRAEQRPDGSWRSFVPQDEEEIRGGARRPANPREPPARRCRRRCSSARRRRSLGAALPRAGGRARRRSLPSPKQRKRPRRRRPRRTPATSRGGAPRASRKAPAVSELEARVAAGIEPNAQQAEKLARRGELEKELAAAMEALAVT